MKKTEFKHVRIRGYHDTGMDVETFVNFLEKRYSMDLRTLPQWKLLIQNMHEGITNLKKKLQDANCRKATIIDKIYIEVSRPSPFELTDDMARTAQKWKNIEAKIRKPKVFLQCESEVPDSVDNFKWDEEIGEASIGHPNTEIIPLPIEDDYPALKDATEVVRPESTVETHLPTIICVNQHKLLSPLRSTDSPLSPQSSVQKVYSKSELSQKDWLPLLESKSIKSFPSTITIENPTLDEQTIKFSLLNLTTEYLNIRFKCVTEKRPFRWAKILPVTPLKLYPGIAVTFKFVCKLFQNTDDFKSNLYFNTGRKVLAEVPNEPFYVPIASNFKLVRYVAINDAVTIPPVYSWHIKEKLGFPAGAINITISEDYSYNLRIMKRLVNFVNSSEDNINSIDVLSPCSESIIQRDEDQDVIIASKDLLISESGHSSEDITSIKTADIISLVITDALDQALDIFVFPKTYLHLKPHSKYSVPVYLTKAEHIGYHQKVYDFEFSDPDTDEVVMTKTVKVYGEVLPNPIQIDPMILDMSDSPVTHGYCEDTFTVSNNHRLIPVTIKIKLTTKMRKLFRVTPMEVLILGNSSANFVVQFCSKDLAHANKEYFVHFTFKIIAVGDKSVYHDNPPLFYEIIAPCSYEFKKTYNKKYFNDVCNDE